MSNDTTNNFFMLPDISKHMPHCADELIAKLTNITESLGTVAKDLNDITFLIVYGKEDT